MGGLVAPAISRGPEELDTGRALGRPVRRLNGRPTVSSRLTLVGDVGRCVQQLVLGSSEGRAWRATCAVAAPLAAACGR